MEKYYRMDDYSYKTESKERVLSNIIELDNCTKGFELGCITIWTGFTNAGKTTVMTMLAKNTIEQGERIFFFNGEQTKDDFKNNLYIQSSTKADLYYKQYKNSTIFDTFVKSEKVAQLNKELANKIYIYNNENKKDINNLLMAMDELNKTQKIRVFFLDNFMQIEMLSENQFQEQTLIMEKLRNFAVNRNVHIHLVAHPRKTERLQSRLTLYDVAGSSNLTNKAYNIISIMRTSNINENSTDYAKLKIDLAEERYNLEDTDCILEILKTKGNRCGLIALKYDKDIKTYSIAQSITEEQKNIIIHETSVKGGKKCPFPS